MFGVCGCRGSRRFLQCWSYGFFVIECAGDCVVYVLAEVCGLHGEPEAGDVQVLVRQPVELGLEGAVALAGGADGLVEDAHVVVHATSRWVGFTVLSSDVLVAECFQVDDWRPWLCWSGLVHLAHPIDKPIISMHGQGGFIHQQCQHGIIRVDGTVHATKRCVYIVSIHAGQYQSHLEDIRLILKPRGL